MTSQSVAPLLAEQSAELSPSVKGGETLLGSQRLDHTQYNQNGLADVWVSISVQQVFDIDTSTQTYGVDLWVNCLYFDPKLQQNPDEYFKGQYIQEDDQKEKLTWDYYPVFHMLNNRGETEQVDFYCLVYDEPATGSVLVSKRFIGRFYEPMKVHAFPFDSHGLEVELFFNDCYVVHHSRDMPTGSFGELTNNEWGIGSEISERMVTLTGASGKSYHHFVCTIDAQRQSNTWIVNFMFPTSVLTLFGGFTMLMENSLANRLSSILTLMLTQAAVKLVLAGYLPKVSYLTVMDQFVLLSFCMMAIAGVEAAAVSKLVGDEWEGAAQKIDRLTFDAYLALWFLMHPLLWCLTCRATRRAARHKHEVVQARVSGSSGEAGPK
mmetsp:Transcript_71847/g.222819  ORF Transcript_71847/g.222819 Transcript_71847/m.222819 type:complete len:379 (-) Transcript_71847:22-1158(-)